LEQHVLPRILIFRNTINWVRIPVKIFILYIVYAILIELIELMIKL